MDGGSVIASSSYWVCLFVSYHGSVVSGEKLHGYALVSSHVRSIRHYPPPNLSSVTNSIAYAPLSLYVTIK